MTHRGRDFFAGLRSNWAGPLRGGFTFGLKQAVGGGLELRLHWPSPDNGIQTIIS